MIKSAFISSDPVKSSQLGDPQTASCLTFQPGNFCWNRAAALAASWWASLTACEAAMYLRSRPSAPLVVAAISTISSDEGGGGGSHTSATDTINASPAAGNPAWTRSSSADSAHFEPSYPISSFIFHLRLWRPLPCTHKSSINSPQTSYLRTRPRKQRHLELKWTFGEEKSTGQRRNYSMTRRRWRSSD